MNNSNIVADAIGAIVVMNTAITNMRLYPATSAMIKNTVDRVNQSFVRLFEFCDTVPFAESEKQLLVCGQPLAEAEMKKPQVVSFLEMLLNFGIKSVEFQKGLETNELLAFIETMGQKPKEIETRGGLKQIFHQSHIQHILLDQKVYVALDKDKQLLSGVKIKDQDIVRYLTGQSDSDAIDLNELHKLTQDPGWVTQIFKLGIQHHKEEKGGGIAGNISETALKLIDSLDAITDKADRKKMSETISSTIADMDENIIGKLLLQKLDRVLDGELITHVIAKLDDEKFKALALRMKQLIEPSELEKGDAKNQKSDLISRTYNMMMASETGKRLEQSIQENLEQEKKQSKEWFSHLKSGLSAILKGEKEPFLDEDLMKKLPTAVDQLYVNKKINTAEAIIDNAFIALSDKNADVCNAALKSIAETMGKMYEKNRLDDLLRISNKLVPWIKSTSQLSPYDEQLYTQLKNLTKKLIHETRFSDCNHILETLNLIASGRLQKSTATLTLSGKILEEISAQPVIKKFLANLKTDDKKRKKQITFSLATLGSPAVETLLDILKDSTDAYERGDIIYVLSKIGHLEISAITDRLNIDQPWYYIRNLTLIIGRVGTRDHLPVLKRYLGHADYRVKEEALTGILTIGGVEGRQYLFSILPSIEDPLKIKIISKIGELKITEATPVLLKMIQSKTFTGSVLKDEIEIKICQALGRIGSLEAVPALNEIVEQKGLLQRKAHNEPVKAAAKKAIEAIENEDSEKKSA
jgi:HEAT repeat protein